jgi:hypothetical protein
MHHNLSGVRIAKTQNTGMVTDAGVFYGMNPGLMFSMMGFAIMASGKKCGRKRKKLDV